MAEPAKKKGKLGHDQIFLEFRKNAKGMALLNHVYDAIMKGHSRMNLRLLGIEETNAASSTSFSCATCTVSSFTENDELVIYSVGSFFRDGMDILKKYLDNETICIPNDIYLRKALAKLLQFVNSSLQSIVPPKKDGQNECEWALQLAEHLFSKLSVDSKFTLDSHYSKQTAKTKDEQFVCPCGKEDQLQGDFGDTSFGCPDVWHGCVDILLENIPVTVTDTPGRNQGRDSLPSDSLDNCDVSSVDVKTWKTFNNKQISQLMSQCIVFSFLQQKQMGNPSVGLLVPSIGINTSSLIVHFYDSKNDVLLQSADLNLFIGRKLNVLTIVFLWLTLNYKYFSSGVTDDMKVYCARFKDHVGNLIDKYTNEIRRPVPRTSQKGLADEERHWAENLGRVVEGKLRLHDFIQIN